MTPRHVTMVFALCSATAWSTRAPAETAERDKEECRTSYEHGQVERSRGHLRAAVADFRSCSRATCAPFMRTDCERWIDEVLADLPALVIAVRDASGEDVRGARVLVDGEVRPEIAEGIALTVDPGEHVLRVDAPGRVPHESHIVVRVGERRRRVDVTLAGRPVIAALPPAGDPPRWPLYALGGLAAAGLGVFGGFAIAGYSVQENRAGSCAPSCSDAQLAPIHTDYRAADAGLGIVVASLGAGVLYYLLTRPHASHEPSVQR